MEAGAPWPPRLGGLSASAGWGLSSFGPQRPPAGPDRRPGTAFGAIGQQRPQRRDNADRGTPRLGLPIPPSSRVSGRVGPVALGDVPRTGQFRPQRRAVPRAKPGDLLTRRTEWEASQLAGNGFLPQRPSVPFRILPEPEGNAVGAAPPTRAIDHRKGTESIQEPIHSFKYICHFNKHIDLHLSIPRPTIPP